MKRQDASTTQSGHSWPKSIAIVTAFYPPAMGGIERYAREFGRAAMKAGLSVNVVTTSTIRKSEITIEDYGISVLRVPARHIAISGGYFPIPTGGLTSVAKHLNCDVIVAHTRFFPTTLMAAAVAGYRGKRICVVEHGSGPLRPNPALAVASMGYEHLATLALRCFTPDFFAVSATSATWLRRFGIDHSHIVPNGIWPRGSAPIRRNMSAKKPVIFFAGRLLPEKGINELLGAVTLLYQEGMDLELRIAGSGPLASTLKQRAAELDFLSYLGPLTPDEVDRELARATLFVNPSNYPEGLPTVLLEAASAALPVISTPRGGSAELIQDGTTGWIVPHGDARLIADCIRVVLARPDEAIRRGAALFRLAQERYAWPNIVRDFLADVRSNCGRQRPRGC